MGLRHHLPLSGTLSSESGYSLRALTAGSTERTIAVRVTPELWACHPDPGFDLHYKHHQHHDLTTTKVFITNIIITFTTSIPFTTATTTIIINTSSSV